VSAWWLLAIPAAGFVVWMVIDVARVLRRCDEAIRR
jgi:hypothetical protein